MLVAVVILLDCAITIHGALAPVAGSPPQASGRCFYQIVEDNRIIASASSAQPAPLSHILTVAGVGDRFPLIDGSRVIPCDRCIKLSNQPRELSVERIPAQMLVAASRRIDINQADETDLRAIPGIGPVTAGKIMRQREQEGSFTSLEDLRRVPGIGKKKLAALEPYIEIRGVEATQGFRNGQTP